MKVKDLISQLQNLPGNLEVVVKSSGFRYSSVELVRIGRYSSTLEWQPIEDDSSANSVSLESKTERKY